MIDDAVDAQLRRFFRERIVPAAEAAHDRGTSFFALAPDPSQTSYWIRRSPTEGYIFELSEDLEQELQRIWKDSPELQALAADLGAMARTMGERREESAEVSSFIYAMF